MMIKQNSFTKEHALFAIDSDFDVLYTIEPTPQYLAALEIYTRKLGKEPPSYLEWVRTDRENN